MKEQEKFIKAYDRYAFGKFIKKRREQLNMSCRELAKKVQMSPVYLSDIERGNRKAPIKTENGKEYMKSFIEYLDIDSNEIEQFYEMAYATRGLNQELQDYIKSSDYILKAMWIAKEINLTDNDWKEIIDYIKRKRYN